MAKMDRSKLAAFAGKPSDGGGDEEDPKDLDHDGEGVEEGGEGDMQEGGDGKFGALIPLLEQFADDVQTCADDVDPDCLSSTDEELSEDDSQALSDAYDGLDGKLKKEMKSTLPEITMDKAAELAQHLSDESLIDDQDTFAGLLFRFGQVLA